MRLLLAALAALFSFLMVVFVIKKTPANTSKNVQAVVASAEKEVMASEALTSEGGIVSTGISGVVNGIYVTEMPEYPIRKIGSSYEAVIVGQRASEAMSIDTMPVGDFYGEPELSFTESGIVIDCHVR